MDPGPTLATLAPVVMSVAESGDLRANALLTLAVEELMLHIRTLARQLFVDERAAVPVALAGGHTELGATSRVRVVRREGSQTTLMLANLDKIKAGDGSTDYLLRKGDLVVVPSAYPVVAGYEIRKVLYPLEVLMRTIGSGLFLAFASGG